MVQSSAHRRLIGNTCLYRDISTRPPTFLRRNLRQALDGHARKLAELNNNRSTESNGPDMRFANDLRTAGWDYPTKEMLQDLLKGQKPILRLQGLQLRRHDAEGARNESKPVGRQLQSEVQINSDNELDWLPDASVDFRAECTVTVMIMQPGSQQSSVWVEPGYGMIESDAKGAAPRTFDIHLDNPFMIQVDDIYITVSSGITGNVRWKRTVPLQYELRVEIKCKELKSTLKFLELLGSKPSTAEHNSLLDREGVIKTSWSTFPECPPTGKLLPLKRAQGHRSLELQYGVELAMGWLRWQGSPLEKYNRSLHRYHVANGTLNHPPTPATLDDKVEVTPTEYAINYVYQSGRHLCKHLQCPLCAVPGGRKHSYSTFDRLYIHLLTYHDHFRFEVEDSMISDSLVQKTIAISASERMHDAIRTLSPKDEDTWIAPTRPFDEKAYIVGKDTWTGHRPQQRKSPQKVARKSAPSQLPHLLTPTAQLLACKPTPKPPLTPSSNPITKPISQTHPVPSVPNISFYRPLSKRPLIPGTRLSSASEIDTTWLYQRLRDDRDSLDITFCSKQFFTDWNAHLNEETLAGDCYLAGSLVRFSQKHNQRLQIRGWKREFETQLHRLRDHSIISDDTVETCLQGPSDTDAMEINVPSPATPQPKPPAYTPRTCVCGNGVEGTHRGGHFCANPHCYRAQFHMKCVGLAYREQGWLCPDCVGAAG